MEEFYLSRKFSKNEIEDSYAKVAWFYDAWSWLTESEAAKIVIEFANIKDGERILEVAVGTGLVFKEVLERNPSGITSGIDVSPSMLFRANKRMRLLGFSNCTLEIGNAYQLAFKDNTFDLLVNNFMIDLLPEKDFDKILAEFHRVIKPSGRVVISTMAFGQKWYNKFWHWLARKYPGLLTGCRPVSITQNLVNVGFVIDQTEQLSQNTLPAEVILAIK